MIRITRLALTDVRRHRSLELRPAPGLTVIRGPNESGKSTIQQALELVLFRRATSTAAEVAAVRRWGSTGEPVIELAFEMDGKPATLVKRFAGTKGSVRLTVDGVAESDPGRVDQLVTAALGIPSEKFYQSTASVRHFKMEELDKDEQALRDRLQKSIGGGDIGASGARKKLDDAITRIRAAGAKNPGPQLRLTTEIARLERELRLGEAALEQLTRDRSTLAAATAARHALEEEVRTATAALEEAETAARLAADRGQVGARYEQLRKATDLAERLAAAEAAPPTAIPLAALRPDVERLRAIELERAEVVAQRAGIALPVVPPAPVVEVGAAPGAPVGVPAPAVDPELRPVPPLRGGRVTAIALGVIALLAVAVGLGINAGSLGPLVGLAIGAVALVVAGLAWRGDARLRAERAAIIAANAEAADRAARDAASAAAAREAAARAAAEDAARRAAADAEARRQAEAALATALAQRHELDARIATLDVESAAIRARLGVADRAAADALLAAAQQHAATLDGLRAELRGLLGTDVVPPLPELRAARDEAAAKAAMGGHALDGLGATGADPEGARLRAQAALRGAQLRLRTAIEEQGQAGGRVAANPADAEQVAAIAEQLDARREELATLQRRLRIYQQTHDAIAAAEAATLQKAARYLERHMAADLGRITDGRYDRVRVNETDLGITVWSPERGAWVDATGLSKGTADQLYLAARLGLVRQVTDDRRPPLVFDDPFVTFDDERALRAMTVLRELAADHQVLYLTCSDRYDPAADAVIGLPAPAIVHVEPPAAAAPPVPEEPFELTLLLEPHPGP
ncbi:MAG: AAA family ATPase [Chloroflexota bacterium]